MFRLNVTFVFMIVLLAVKIGMGSSSRTPLSISAAEPTTENTAETLSFVKDERDHHDYSPSRVATKEERAATSAATSPAAMSTNNNDGTLTVTKFNGHGLKQTLYNFFGLNTRRLRHV